MEKFNFAQHTHRLVYVIKKNKVNTSLPKLALALTVMCIMFIHVATVKVLTRNKQ